LNLGNKLTSKEFLCRLVHVCMVEVGFIPVVADEEEEFAPEELFQSQFSESVPKLVRRLQRIIAKRGSLQSVSYKAIVIEEFTTATSEDQPISSNAPQKKHGTNIPVTGKDSGDASLDSVTEVASGETLGVESLLSSSNIVIQWRKAYSEKISVTTIYDEREMIIVASGPGFSKTTPVSIFQYIHTRNMSLPTGTMDEFLRMFNFSPCSFVNDVKQRFCYPVMDEADGLSFDIRSIAWFPPEVIIEIAKHCSPHQVFRLRATCFAIEDALGKTNIQFWKYLLRRDFPQYNVNHLRDFLLNPRDDKYYEKYCDLCRFTFRRPVRRTLGHSRMFPLYLSNNFRP